MANRMISFGYGIDGNKICVIDREAVVVREIFEKYAAGKLLQEIADELTALNSKSPFNTKVIAPLSSI